MPIPVVTVAQMREWEKVTWASGIKEDAVMRRAGAAVARLAEKLTRPDDFVLFLAGKGHNGDDAAYGCDFITQRRRELVRVIDPAIGAKEIAAHLQRKPVLLVDGLFGIGLNSALSGAWLKLIDRINQSRVPILAVDVPSGLSADSGLPLEVAIRATCTLTFGAVKRGLLKTSAASFVGRLEVAPDIGLVPYPFTTELSLTTPEDFKDYPPPRPVGGHKGTFGHLAIIAGSPGFHGAAVLAARGAQRAQPGLITLLTNEAVFLPVAAQLQAVMVHAVSDAVRLPESCTAILMGPGLASSELSERFKRAARRLWMDSPLPLIADASALDWLPAGPCAEGVLRVITPHPGEAARLLKSSVAEVQQDRVAAVCELSRRWANCHVVLKGHQTIVGHAREDVFANNSGNPHLAQGGSGDLLAGYLGGLLAQPELLKDASLALRFGVWQHGAAADALLATRPNFTVEDLAEELGRVRP
jgi:NAD(P)H-hydrate epimerase